MNFNVEKVTNDIIVFIKDYYEKNNAKGAVIGLSGGKDSAVCLALITKAIGKENVLALWLPSHSKKSDKRDAYLLANQFDVEIREFNLEKYSDNFMADMKKINNVNNNDLTNVSINLKPRLRMLTLYAYAALMTKINNKNYLVVGTSNKSERFVGYFTKGGDNVCDIAPIADLYVDEVIAIGDYLGLPKHITHKTPDDGLSGISDEEKLGFTYTNVRKVSEEYEKGIVDSSLDEETRNKILKKHHNNLHKFYLPIYRRNN